MSGAICGGHTAPWVAMPLDPIRNEPTAFGTAVRCGECGTGTIMRKPTVGQVADFYRLPVYYTHGESHIRPVPPRFVDRLLTKLSWWLDHQRPFDAAGFSRLLGPAARVFDIGCGDGTQLAAFAARGHAVVGVEPDAAARDVATARGLAVLAGTAEVLPDAVAPAAFDLLVMSHSLEHCSDAPAALRAAAARVRPGGLLYVEVPNCGSVHFEALLANSTNFDAPRHLWFFTPSSLRRLAELAGLRPLGWRYHGFTRHHARDWRAWELTIADRRAAHGRPAGPRHSLLRSTLMLAREAVAGKLRKYDAIGLVAQAPAG